MNSQMEKIKKKVARCLLIGMNQVGLKIGQKITKCIHGFLWFKTALVIPLASGTMRHGNGILLTGDLDLSLCN